MRRNQLLLLKWGVKEGELPANFHAFLDECRYLVFLNVLDCMATKDYVE